MILLGVSGKRGSGKTSLANILKRKHGWIHIPFALTLKKKCQEELGLTKEETDGNQKERPCKYAHTDGKPMTPREIMIRMGFFYRTIDPDYWIKKTFDLIKDTTDSSFLNRLKGYTKAEKLKFVISDVRFKNEVVHIKDAKGYILRLDRDPALNIYKDPIEDVSEMELDDYDKFDILVGKRHNQVMADLEKLAETLNRDSEKQWKHSNLLAKV